MIFNFGEKFTPKFLVTENFGTPKFLEACVCNNNKKPKRLENSQLIRKTWHVNQIFELILEQWVANYYGDNTIVK